MAPLWLFWCVRCESLPCRHLAFGGIASLMRSVTTVRISISPLLAFALLLSYIVLLYIQWNTAFNGIICNSLREMRIHFMLYGIFSKYTVKLKKRWRTMCCLCVCMCVCVYMLYFSTHTFKKLVTFCWLKELILLILNLLFSLVKLDPGNLHSVFKTPPHSSGVLSHLISTWILFCSSERFSQMASQEALLEYLI